MNVQLPSHILYSRIRPVTTTVSGVLTVYSGSIRGIVHMIVVAVDELILQILFLAVPMNMLLVPVEVAKL